MYVTAKHKMYCCNKGESPQHDDNIVVVACALVNGCADESKENLQVHYIATKVQYEGLGYASLLIYKLLLHMKTKNANRLIIFVMYREIPNSIAELSDDLPPGRKASLSKRNRTSPLGFIYNMGLSWISDEDRVGFYTNDLYSHHVFFHTTCNAVITKLRRQIMCVNDSVEYEYISCHAIQKKLLQSGKTR